MELVKLIKKQMVDKDRNDFGVYLSEILGISPQAASKKLSGKAKISIEDLGAITRELDLNAENLKGALIRDSQGSG